LDRALSYKGQIEELGRRLSQGLDSMGFTERRELPRLLVDEVVHDNGQVTIRTITPLDQLHPIPGGLRPPGPQGVGPMMLFSSDSPQGGESFAPMGKALSEGRSRSAYLTRSPRSCLPGWAGDILGRGQPCPRHGPWIGVDSPGAGTYNC